MHARTQPKRIGIKHGVARIDHLELTASARGIACTRHLLWHHLLALHRLLIEAARVGHLLLAMPLLVELRWEVRLHLIRRRVRAVGIGVGVVEHGVCVLRVVFLFCTHGINLGRTEFYWG